MATPRDLLAQAKSAITEIDGEAASARLEAGDATFLDVREPDEYQQGTIPGAIHLPRGQLEFSVEGLVPDKVRPLVVYCAGGVRSAFAARTLGELGYQDVVSLIGGFNRWKDDGRRWETPRTLTPEQRNRYQRHLLLPEVGEKGQQKLLDSKVLLLGAGGLGSPAALYLAAAGVGTLGIIDMDVVDESNLQRQVLHNMDRVGERKVDSAKKTITLLNPDVDVATYDVRLGADNILDIIDGYDVILDGTDNFPTRYLVNDALSAAQAHPRRAWLDLPVRRPGDGVRPLQRAVLPVPHPRAAAGGAGPLVLRGRRARRATSASSGRSRRSRPSRCCSAWATRWSAGSCPTTRWRRPSAPSRCGATSACPACGENAAPIVIAEYDELCMPHRHWSRPGSPEIASEARWRRRNRRQGGRWHSRAVASRLGSKTCPRSSRWTTT